MLWILGVFFLSWTSSVVAEKRFLFSSDVCFGDLGCFTKKAPFGGTSERPVAFLPDSPDKIGAKFQLYTRSNPTTPFVMKYTDVNNNIVGPFEAVRPTKFVIHGFLDSEKTPWPWGMKDVFLSVEDVNVIVVDWTNGNGLPYEQATANTQVVGAQIAQLLKSLMDHVGLRLPDVHLIGHSLGAHLAGYAGKRLRGIGRITGLDPANPYFQYTDVVVRLDSTDANFVDILHSDAGASVSSLGFGMVQAIGHVDFYPNGGSQQPGCPVNAGGKVEDTLLNLLHFDFSGASGAVTCNHGRAYELFIDTITSACPFTAYPCANYTDFLAGKCTSCRGAPCPRMGYHADAGQSLRGSFQLSTGSSSPFCHFHYFVTLRTAAGVAGHGAVSVKLTGDKGVSDTVALLSANSNILPGTTYSVVITSATELGAINSVSVQYTKSGNGADSVALDAVNVVAGEQQIPYRLCATDGQMHSGVTTLTDC